MIGYVVGHRLRAGFRSILGAGVALGVVLGLSLASFAGARDTASAYGRVLEAADAETAVVSHGLAPDDAAEILDAQPAISRHRYEGGFVAVIEGADPALAGGLLAAAEDEFALELPTLEAGRLPDPDRAEEVFVNSFLADEGGYAVGDELTLLVRSFESDEVRPVPIKVVGIGIFPREAVADDTVLNGIIVLTRAFFDANEDLRVYANDRLWLDDPGELPALARTLSAEGMELTETRADERRGVEAALQPSVTVLVALGLLAALATVVLAVQVAQRRNERWRADDVVLTALGTERSSRSLIHLASVAAEVTLAAAIALAVMLVVSPRAPIGPLHELEPVPEVHLDGTVAVVGITALAVVLTLSTLALAFGRSEPARAAERPGQITARARQPSSLAGMSLAVRSRRRTSLRLAIATTAGAMLLAGVATVAVSARAVIDTPPRYGVDFDVLAFNAFGDQTDVGIEAAFGGPDVTSAASFTSWAFLVDGHPVPGLGVDPIRGVTGPTILEGEPLRHDDEIVLGIDTAERLGVTTGDQVSVQTTTTLDNGPPLPPRPLRVVGLATFAAISQQGTDDPRLGLGALVTQPTFEAMIDSTEDGPEWTVASLDGSTTPEELIAANPDGIEDTFGIPTRWFTQARPAELVQLDAAAPVLAASLVMSLLLLAALLVQGSWSRTRSSRAELSVLQALGCSRQQLARAAAWQPVPAGIAAIVVGIPLGIAAGRLGFSAFARSIAVVDDPTSPAWLIGALVLAVLASVALAALVSGQVARRVPSAATLRDATGRRA